MKTQAQLRARIRELKSQNEVGRGLALRLRARIAALELELDAVRSGSSMSREVENRALRQKVDDLMKFRNFMVEKMHELSDMSR